MTIVQVGRGNGGGEDGGSDLLRLEPPSDLRPAPSPLSDTSATLQSDNNDTLAGGEKYTAAPLTRSPQSSPLFTSPRAAVLIDGKNFTFNPAESSRCLPYQRIKERSTDERWFVNSIKMIEAKVIYLSNVIG